jgi:ligand-binding sensor domain-containing protein
MARLGLVLGLLCLTGSQGRGAGASFAHDYLTQSWTTDHGLPHNAVHRVEQDRTGYLWLATAGGLVRFDGLEFRTFTPPPELSHGDHEIRDLTIDPDGGLLIVSGTGGVLRFRDGVFSAHPIARGLETGSVRELFVEPDGSLWIGTSDATLLRWQDGRLESYGKAEGITAFISPATDRE